MRRALPVYLDRLARGGSHDAAVIAAAEAVADDPWAVVASAGLLARCVVEAAVRDTGLDARLRLCAPGAFRSLVTVPAGAPLPRPRSAGRKRRGAFDTPADMARHVVGLALREAEQARSGLDPACGTGAFLVAMARAGLQDVRGADVDPLALRVASIAAPAAHLELADGLEPGESADIVVGNPPYVSPERQARALRDRARARFPWLSGRFDLVVPLAAASVERARLAAALVLPASVLHQRYGAPLRRRWVQSHRLAALEGPVRFPGASVDVVQLALAIGAGPAPLAPHGVPARAVLALDAVPLDPAIVPGDFALAARVRAASVPLGDLALVDTGVVSHRPGGSREALLHDAPGPGRVPYADAREFFAGRHRWLEYAPERMHRAKRPSMFEEPKVVVQRILGQGPVRAAIDRSGTYVGHTCTVVQPRDAALSLQVAHRVLTTRALLGVLRVERGRALDLYPRDVAALPVPRPWLAGQEVDVAAALGLEPAAVERLAALA